MSEKVCVATYGINLNKPEFIKSLIKLIQDWDSVEEIPILFHLEYGKLIHMAQEMCVVKALTERCTHILFTEDDTSYIPDGALRRLLDYNVDVVGAFAYARHYPYYSMIFKKTESQKDLKWISDEIPTTVLIDPDQGLQKVDMIPYQFTLIKTDVFKKLESPWFFYDTRSERLTDFWFADRCFDAGIQMYCDTDLIVKHGDIDGTTAGYYVMKDAAHIYGKSRGNWKSEAVGPLMDLSGFDVSTEMRERMRLEKGF